MSFRDDALAGRHVVISGGCGAIGLGVVKKLADHGASVTVNDILEPAIAEERLRAGGLNLAKTSYVRADLTQAAEVDTLIQEARSRFGPIHTALCHVGMVIPKPLLEFSEQAWDQTMAVNVKTAFLLGQAAARAMLADRVRGHLIFTTSWVAEVPWPEIGAYNARFLFLCSAAADYMTGAVLLVDGGCSLYPMD